MNQSYSYIAERNMARYVLLVFLLNLVSVAISHPEPDAPLNTVVFSSAPILRQATSPQYLQVSPQPNAIPAQTQRVVTAGAPPPGTVFQIVQSPPEQLQPAPNNFVAFTQTPTQQIIQPSSESVPRNFVTFSRTPSQQVVQSAAQPVQSFPRNFVTFTRSPAHQLVQTGQQQDFGTRPVLAAAPAQNEQPGAQFAVRAGVPKQFGVRTVFLPAPSPAAVTVAEGTPASSSASPSQPQRTVFVFSPQQQTNALPAGGAAAAPPQSKLRTVLVSRPAQVNAEQLPSANRDDRPSVVSSSQYFTRNFGDSGTVTYLIQPLSALPPPSKQPSPDAET